MNLTYDEILIYKNTNIEKYITLLTDLAKQGNVRAQNDLAICYYLGEGIIENKSEAVYWYKKAAEQDNSEAQYNLATCYYLGHGVESDIKQAMYWYEKSAEQGIVEAQYNLAILCEQVNEISKALYCYEIAAEKGYEDAVFRLGMYYMDGQYVEQNLSKAIQYFMSGAELGNVGCQNNLAFCYDQGYGISQSYEKAFNWYMKAALKGNAIAQYNIAQCYEYAKYVEKDYGQAVCWYTKAIEQGHIGSCFYLGYLYEKGYGVEQNYIKAIELYKKAAESGNEQAQYNLGCCYEYGKGVDIDFKMAFELYQESANKGYMPALNNLATCYAEGKGIEQDIEKAVELFRLAVNQGYSLAIMNLGICYEYGKGTSKNLLNALELYRELEEKANLDEQAYKYLSILYYRLGYFYYYGNGVPVDLLLAKECFEKSKELGEECDYILETINNQLGIKKETSQFKLLLNSVSNIKELRTKILLILNEYNFQGNTLKFLTTAIIDFYNKISDEEYYNYYDYSGVILELTKGLENELQRYLFDKYLMYLEKVGVDKVTNKYLLNKDKKINTKRFEKFTLGELKDLIGVKDYLIVNISLDDKSKFINLRLINEETKKINTLDSGMLSYLKDELFDVNKFGIYIDEEITDYMVKFSRIIYQINDELRNPSAHTKYMNVDNAERMIDWILFGKKILPTFLEKLRK